MEMDLSVEQNISCFCRHYYPHSLWMQPYLSSYTCFHLTWKHGIDTDAICKVYISETTEVRVVICTGMNGLDVHHFQQALQCLCGLFFSDIVSTIFQMHVFATLSVLKIEAGYPGCILSKA